MTTSPAAATGSAYDARAADYIDALGFVDATSVRDREMIEDWADGVDGPLLDAGCGPGHWAAHLARRRSGAVTGIDVSERFVASARERFPEVSFARGDLTRAPYPDGEFGGILAWFSLIHTPPGELDAMLSELARVLRPGGSLLVGYFTGAGAGADAFDHAVTTAYAWDPAWLAGRIRDAGFATARASERHEHGMRPQGEIVAVRATRP